MRFPIFALLLVIASLVAWGGAVFAQGGDADLERKLGALKARIAVIEREQRQAAGQRDQESRALREAEEAVARESRALADTRRERSAAAARTAELAARRTIMAAGLEADSEALAAELRAAWIAGGEPQLKVLLSQRDPAQLGRMLTWYGYVARQRAVRVEDLRIRLAKLAELSREVEEESARLAAAESRLTAAVTALEEARATRAVAVSGLDADLARRGREAERLKAEAAALEQLIGQLRAAVVDLPVPDSAPFIQQRGRLTWPVGGALARAFGERRGEGLQSNGVLIAAERGAEVRAVWHGRVAYSDWLPGLGLLLVLEHGDGYMSLYGHNEVLFSAVGDWVNAGQVVSQVGDSGGRDQAGLYFEIRSGTKPQNPAQWFATRTPRN